MLSFFIFRLNTVLYKEISKKFKKQSLKNGIGMGYIRYCKIKIKNFKKKLKKSVDKEAKQPYNKTRSAEGTEELKRNRE